MRDDLMIFRETFSIHYLSQAPRETYYMPKSQHKIVEPVREIDVFMKPMCLWSVLDRGTCGSNWRSSCRREGNIG